MRKILLIICHNYITIIFTFSFGFFWICFFVTMHIDVRLYIYRLFINITKVIELHAKELIAKAKFITS